MPRYIWAAIVLSWLMLGWLAYEYTSRPHGMNATGPELYGGTEKID